MATPHLEQTASTERLLVDYIRFERDRMVIAFVEGNEVSVPLAWYPKLCHASEAQLSRYQIMEFGKVLRWPELDEEIFVNELVN